MKTGFKNRTAIKQPKEMKSPWSFECPPYDERSSCFINAGTNYGTGVNQPVGKTSVSDKSPIPKGTVSTLRSDYVYKGKPGLFEVPEGE